MAEQKPTAPATRRRRVGVEEPGLYNCVGRCKATFKGPDEAWLIEYSLIVWPELSLNRPHTEILETGGFSGQLISCEVARCRLDISHRGQTAQVQRSDETAVDKQPPIFTQSNDPNNVASIDA